MGRFGCFLLGFLLGGATIYGSLHYHLVRAHDGFHFIPKLTSTFSQTYVDIREFGFEQWAAHQSLALAITRAEKTELMHGVAVEPLRETLNGFLDRLEGATP